MLFPDGSRNAESIPYGRSSGSSENSTPRALSSSYEAWQSSVVRKIVPANPLPIRFRTSSAVSASITGGPGIAISTTAMSGWPGGATVSQRKSPSSASVTSDCTSKPTFSVQNASASSWSCTHSWTVPILIIVSSLVRWLRGDARDGRSPCLLETCCVAARRGSGLQSDLDLFERRLVARQDGDSERCHERVARLERTQSRAGDEDEG